MLDQAGKCRPVALTGLGLPNPMRKYVKKGCAKKFGLWNERDFGYLAAYVAQPRARRQADRQARPVVHRRAGSASGRVGASDGNAPVVVLGDPLVFTPQNIDKFNF